MIRELIEQLGYPALFLLLALESVGVPLPGEAAPRESRGCPPASPRWRAYGNGHRLPKLWMAPSEGHRIPCSAGDRLGSLRS